MVGTGVDAHDALETGGGERQSAYDVNERVDDHHVGSSLGLGRLHRAAKVVVLDAAVDDPEECAIEEDGAELGDENPEVVSPYTQAGVFGVDPALSHEVSSSDDKKGTRTYPSSGANVKIVAIGDSTNDGGQEVECPDGSTDGVEGVGVNLVGQGDTSESVEANGNGPPAACEIAYGDEPALGVARGRLDVDCIAHKPLDVDEEGDGLLEIGKEKVEDKEDELILDAMGLSPPPGQESAGKNSKKRGGGNK